MFDFVQDTLDDTRIRDNVIPEMANIYVDDKKYIVQDINKLY